MAIVWPVILSVRHNDGDLIGDVVFVRNSFEKRVPDWPLDLVRLALRWCGSVRLKM